jgi:hypothetical protein
MTRMRIDAAPALGFRFSRIRQAVLKVTLTVLGLADVMNKLRKDVQEQVARPR